MVFSNAGHLYTHIFVLLYATAVLFLPSVFDVSYGELLGLSSFGLVLFGLGAMPAGWLGDRWSKVGMLLVFFLGMGISTVVIGMANDTATLFLGLSLLGLFGSIYHPVGIAWLVTCAKRQGLALGVNGVFGNVGSAVAPVFVGLMIDYVSWRAAFVIPGIVSIATGCVFAFAWWRGVIGDIHADRAPSPAARARKLQKSVRAADTYHGLQRTRLHRSYEYGAKGIRGWAWRFFRRELHRDWTLCRLSHWIVLSIQHSRWLARRPVLRPHDLRCLLGVDGAPAVVGRVDIRCAATGHRPDGAVFQRHLRSGGEHACRAAHPLPLASVGIRFQVLDCIRYWGTDRAFRRQSVRQHRRLRFTLCAVRGDRIHCRHRRILSPKAEDKNASGNRCFRWMSACAITDEGTRGIGTQPRVRVTVLSDTSHGHDPK